MIRGHNVLCIRLYRKCIIIHKLPAFKTSFHSLDHNYNNALFNLISMVEIVHYRHFCDRYVIIIACNVNRSSTYGRITQCPVFQTNGSLCLVFTVYPLKESFSDLASTRDPSVYHVLYMHM